MNSYERRRNAVKERKRKQNKLARQRRKCKDLFEAERQRIIRADAELHERELNAPED